MYTVSAEQHERTMMEAHQKFVMDHGYMTRKISRLNAQIAEKDEQLAKQEDQLAKQEDLLAAKDNEIASLKQALAAATGKA